MTTGPGFGEGIGAEVVAMERVVWEARQAAVSAPPAAGRVARNFRRESIALRWVQQFNQISVRIEHVWEIHLNRGGHELLRSKQLLQLTARYSIDLMT